MSVSKSLGRRDLLMWMGAGFFRPQLRAQSGDTMAQVRPDLVIWNARAITMDPRQPAAEAFAIRDGRFRCWFQC
jgi:hypothetical protein